MYILKGVFLKIIWVLFSILPNWGKGVGYLNLAPHDPFFAPLNTSQDFEKSKVGYYKLRLKP